MIETGHASLLMTAATHLHEAARRRLQRAVDAIAAETEKRLAKLFLSEGMTFVRLFARLRDRFPDDAVQETVLGEDEWVRLLLVAQSNLGRLKRAVIGGGIEGALLLGGQALLNEMGLGLRFDLKNPRAVEYLSQHGAELVSHIDETTRDYIRTVITRGVDEGWSYDRMAQAIIDRYQEFAVGQPQLHIDSRAHLIATTETAFAYEEGSAIVAHDLQDKGLLMEKSWLTVGDDRVSDECRANEEEGWIPLDAVFSSGDENPPAHPACRCTTLYRRKGEEETT